MLRRIFLLVAIGSFGCGQTTSGNDAGPDGQVPDVDVGGCFNGHSNDVPYDASACVPQLKSTFSCNGSICSWNVILPCTPASDAGDAGDDAGFDCQKACNDAKPSGVQGVSGFCQPGYTNDAGTVFTCGGCGV